MVRCPPWANPLCCYELYSLSVLFLIVCSHKKHTDSWSESASLLFPFVFSHLSSLHLSAERAQTHTGFGRVRNLSLQIIPKDDAAFNVIVEGESIPCLSRSTQKILHYKFMGLLWKISLNMWIEGSGILSKFIVGRHLCLGQTSWVVCIEVSHLRVLLYNKKQVKET